MVNVSAGMGSSKNNVSTRRHMHADQDEEDSSVHSDDSNFLPVHVHSEHLQDVTLDNDVVMVGMETERGIPVEEDLTGLSAKSRKKRQVRFGMVVLVGFVLTIVLGVSIPTNKPVAATSNNDPEMSPDLQVEVEAMRRFMRISNLMGEISPRVRQSGSSQEWAAQWMAGLIEPPDSLQMPVPDSLDEETAPPFVERFVLATLYHATQGALWRNNYYFLYPKGHCTWFYFDNENFDPTQIKSKDSQAPRGVLCNPEAHANDYRVEEIWIANNNLKGQLPSELGLLKGLKILSLDGNRIHGTIPSDLAKLTNLEHLHLEYNRLSGEIEQWVGHSYHKNMKTLVLSNNLFTGKIPNSLRLLTHLTLLALDDNQLGGRPLSIVGNLKNLKYLYLEDNKFSDSVHVENSFPDLTELIHLDLSNNNFHNPTDKTWPHQWLSLPKLEVLDVSNNKFRGSFTVPKAPDDSKLKFLSLQDNELEGTLPKDIHTYSALTHLDLSGNALTGHRPDERLANMKNLTYLFLGGTNFTEGPFPTVLTILTDLRELSLKQSNLNGTLPEAIARLSNLLLLDLEGNDIEGQIPSAMGNLTKLGFLLLNRNRLTGTVPTTLDELTRVELMLLNDNDLSGDVSFLCTTLSDTTGIPDDAPQQHKLDILMADCGDGGSVNCTCCHTCCPAGESCNNATEWLGNKAGIWEFGYQRIKWSFDGDDKFSWLPVYIQP